MARWAGSGSHAFQAASAVCALQVSAKLTTYADPRCVCFGNSHTPTEADGPITLHYNKYVDGSKIGTPATVEVDMVIGADGANSRVAKEIDAGEYDYAIAFQERIRIPGECQYSGCRAVGSPSALVQP